MQVVGLTPFERPDARLVRSLARSGRLALLDLGRDPRKTRQALIDLGDTTCGVRVPEGVAVSPSTWPAGVHTVVAPLGTRADQVGGRRLFVEVRSVEEALEAIADGAHGVVGVGHEAGGRVGPQSAFVLAQALSAAALTVPFWIRGGIGRHSAAAAQLAGAEAVIVEGALALAVDVDLPGPVRAALKGLDGSELAVLGGHRVFVRPDLPGAKLLEADEATIRPLLGTDLATQLVPMGQDAAFAARLARTHRTAGAILSAIEAGLGEHLLAAHEASALAEGSRWAVAHGTRWPIVQGPMTRVSDTAAFAHAVSSAGALPFLALSMLTGPASEALLRETAATLGDLPWGVGILGFVPPELRDPQLAAILEVRPPFALIAGGRPSQARQLEDAGIPAYLHAPSPTLTRAFLADGARRFVFEGRECGGHVGPRSSFVLWEQQIDVLLDHAELTDVHVLFAGGIHDARSAAMVMALAGPLLARGAHVGLLMGTAYLFTHEAVASGAITQAFQDAALTTTTTALLETAPGHATRCAPGPFVATFEATKARLRADGVPSKEAWAQLEDLNVGRLRIASKGVERTPAGLVSVDAARQLAEGMVMIGEVAALRHEALSVAELHATTCEGGEALLAAASPLRVASVSAARPADIAIVGMAAILPDAPDLDTYWRHILDGHDAVSEVPDSRWRADLYFDANGTPGDTTPSRWGAFVPTIDFDPLLFGIPPRSLGAIDPAQILSLEVTRRALVDAGYDHRPFPRERTSVVFGTESGSDLGSAYSFRAHWRQFVGELPPALDEALPRLSEDSFPGVLANVLAGRIANRLDLGGTNYTVDAACASSLAALDVAIKELAAHTSDVVLCGGADLHNGINDYLLFSATHALSPRGRCRTFDAEADGIVLGEGIACVVLKRLADAERDGDRIYAVVRGVGGSSDGKSLGLTAPRKEGQKRAVARAWEMAGLNPADAGLVEAHGTGTVVGDRTEISTLSETFGTAPGRITLGSVKSQIGHTKCAAGLAGLIKTSLALYHGVRPPTSQLTQPNSVWDPATSPFHFTTSALPWPDARRIAAVSAFGFGGTNFHAVLEAHDPQPQRPSARRAELFLLRGTPAQVDRALALITARLADPAPASLGSLARAAGALAQGPVSLAIVATSHADLAGALDAAQRRTAVPQRVWIAQRSEPGLVAFLFPGQGSQRPGMLRDLFVAYPDLNRFLAAAPDAAAHIHPPTAFDAASTAQQHQRLQDTRVAQPALGMVSLAVAAWLDELGVRGAMAAGHSYGEVAALAWAGAMDLPTLVALSRARAEAILTAAPEDAGTMAAVTGSAEAIAVALTEHPGVVLANHNAPQQTVISGATAAVDAAVKHLEAVGLPARRIPVAAAFHSPLLADAPRRLAEALAGLDLGSTTTPVYSNETAAPLPAEPSALKAAIASQVGAPVRFVEQIEAMYAAGARVFVEVGPGRVLTGLVGKILGSRPHQVVAFEETGAAGEARLLAGIAQLACAGVAVDADALFAGRGLADVDLAAQPVLSKALWKVNGHLAVPANGPLPAGSLRPILEPLGLPAAAPMIAPSGGGDQAVLTFLQNMQSLADAQRDAMLAYLDAGPRTPRPAALPAAVVVQAPVAAPVVVAAPAAQLALLPLLSGIVSELTGYPPEMLDAHADLEADLSIDSIKRIEVLTTLGERLGGRADALDDKAVEALATKKSLAEMVAWLEPRLGGASPPQAAQSAAPVDLLPLLSGIVSELTGYPPEMLDAHADLEADLSIDSIKRIEVLTTLGERLGSRAGALDDKAVEALATKKSLAEMVAWLEPKLGGSARASAPPQAAAAEVPSGIRRYRMVPVAAPLEPTPAVASRRIRILDPNATRGRALADALRARGHDVPLTDVPGPAGADTVVQLDGLGPVHAFGPLKAALEGGAHTVLGIDSGSPGIDGLYRTAAREYPDAVVRLIGPSDASPDGLAALLTDELTTRPGPSVVRWRDAARETLVLQEAPLVRASTPLPLDRESVVLITGGARGITARIVAAMAAEVPCTYVIVGRSALPTETEDAEVQAAADATALRKLFLQRGLGKPATIEAAVQAELRARELRDGLDALTALGATVDYRALDVRDAAALTALVADVYARYGRLDGVVHAAGVLDDRLMREKTTEGFERVFETKVNGAQVFTSTLRDDVRFVVFFGSISGVLGNRGQADYSAANSALDAMAADLGSRVAGRVVTIDWGPWGGAGMVGPELARAYAKRGIPLIDPDEGVRAFLDELRSGNRSDHQVVWQAGPADAFGGPTRA